MRAADKTIKLSEPVFVGLWQDCFAGRKTEFG